MSNIVRDALRQSARVKLSAAESLGQHLVEATRLLVECLSACGQAFVVGNGGSAADAQHFAAEFTGKFRHDRVPLPVIALTTDTSALTCIGNDFGYEQVFSRQIEALGRAGDVLFALSTSGTSPNVVNAARAARLRGVRVVGFTGRAGGDLAAECDVLIAVPSDVTARIQECHMTALHSICELTEHLLFASPGCQAPKTLVGSQRQVLAARRDEWRRQGLQIVSTNGCFDVLHVGHLQSLRLAAELGDLLVVLVNSDESVRRLKGSSRPVNPADARVQLLQALEPVHDVLVFEEDDPSELLSVLRPDVHCKGEEYRDGRLPMPEAAIVRAHGGLIRFLPRHVDMSSTIILEQLGEEAISG